MDAAWWIVLGVIAIVIVALLATNSNKKEEIECLRKQLDDQKTRLQQEISLIKDLLISGKITESSSASKSTPILNELRIEIAQSLRNTQEISDSYQQKYYKVMRAYIVARRLNEIDVIQEIEDSLSQDYESLETIEFGASQYVASLMADFYTSSISESKQKLIWMRQFSRATKIEEVRKDAALLVERAKKSQYAYHAAIIGLMKNHPEITSEYISSHFGISFDDSWSPSYVSEKTSKLTSQIETLHTRCIKYKQKLADVKQQYLALKNKYDDMEKQIVDFESYYTSRWHTLHDSVEGYQQTFSSNLTAIPYMSRIVSDIMTIDIDRLILSLSWGNNQERKKKVDSLNDLRKRKAEEIQHMKWAEYQLAFLLELYPSLQDVLDAEFQELNPSFEQIEDVDPVSYYVERDAWNQLSETERNQLALDRYVESRKKSKWQIGRDYELYCGYLCEKKGYAVDYYGSYNGLEDLGRDLIITLLDSTYIIQCKYWSTSKQIHEKHIMQLYGSVIEYNMANEQHARGVLVTNTVLSSKARQFADALGIVYVENVSIGEFPRIKCNIGTDESGKRAKIYHLPFDQQYDKTKIDGLHEFMAMTVAEAEAAGFRRAYKWHSK